MDQFLAGFSAFVTGAISAAQRFGIITYPLIVVIAVVVNMWFGEKGIKAMAITIACVTIMLVVLTNASNLSSWANGGFQTTGAGQTVVTQTPVPHA